jgi:hypothetical protein
MHSRQLGRWLCVAGASGTVYDGYFDKYVCILYIFVNMYTYVICFAHLFYDYIYMFVSSKWKHIQTTSFFCGPTLHCLTLNDSLLSPQWSLEFSLFLTPRFLVCSGGISYFPCYQTKWYVCLENKGSDWYWVNEVVGYICSSKKTNQQPKQNFITWRYTIPVMQVQTFFRSTLG